MTKLADPMSAFAGIFVLSQYRLLVSLCGSEFKNVLMVGDPKQAIYVWNGADPKYLDLFERDFAQKKSHLPRTFDVRER